MPNCTVIKLKAVDQRLAVVQQPLLASGDVGSVRVEYELDSYWDGYAPSGTFYASKHPEDIYEAPLTDGACVVPWEVLQEDGILYIGLRGVDEAGLVKTAAPVRYRVDKGSPSGNDTAKEPTPDVYQQLMGLFASAEAKATEAAAGVAGVEELAAGADAKAAEAATQAAAAETKADEALAGLSTAGKPTRVTASGVVSVTVADNTEYWFTDVTSLTLEGLVTGRVNHISFHGFVFFSDEAAPTVSGTGVTTGYVMGDDIREAAAGETWEFTFHSGFLVWVRWELRSA